MKKLMKGSVSARNGPVVMSRTIADIKPEKSKDFETNIVDRINEFSAME